MSPDLHTLKYWLKKNKKTPDKPTQNSRSRLYWWRHHVDNCSKLFFISFFHPFIFYLFMHLLFPVLLFWVLSMQEHKNSKERERGGREREKEIARPHTRSRPGRLLLYAPPPNNNNKRVTVNLGMYTDAEKRRKEEEKQQQQQTNKKTSGVYMYNSLYGQEHHHPSGRQQQGHCWPGGCCCHRGRLVQWPYLPAGPTCPRPCTLDWLESLVVYQQLSICHNAGIFWSVFIIRFRRLPLKAKNLNAYARNRV